MKWIIIDWLAFDKWFYIVIKERYEEIMKKIFDENGIEYEFDKVRNEYKILDFEEARKRIDLPCSVIVISRPLTI